ncbi:putative aryl-alcohol dehydrogenase aad14 [Sporothrix stenoceras]|uniref:Aryl-alcohol dehydrogenase aad14 n=1 Tax=Sporothrix stenoceras TaxID=5173 RepID=A0ABR3YJV1_9PEZI
MDWSTVRQLSDDSPPLVSLSSDSESNKRSHLSYYRQRAPTASVRVSPLCLGATTFGQSHAERYGEMTKETAFKILDTYFDTGGNFIDTANSYRGGESELWFGEWMQKCGNRDSIVLATKFTTLDENHAKGQIAFNFVLL